MNLNLVEGEFAKQVENVAAVNSMVNRAASDTKAVLTDIMCDSIVDELIDNAIEAKMKMVCGYASKLTGLLADDSNKLEHFMNNIRELDNRLDN
ncbi:hypothetical protein [Butyrivibrio sp. AE3003]|uniref:hypothetical protein n=1 Tax=Butyrivibrio sp. AE3003 TaxID=1496721 RepID=UPI0004794C79|nr:hypothetical protein [Butyrivibrio sp. AE3003]